MTSVPSRPRRRLPPTRQRRGGQAAEAVAVAAVAAVAVVAGVCKRAPPSGS